MYGKKKNQQQETQTNIKKTHHNKFPRLFGYSPLVSHCSYSRISPSLSFARSLFRILCGVLQHACVWVCIRLPAQQPTYSFSQSAKYKYIHTHTLAVCQTIYTWALARRGHRRHVLNTARNWSIRTLYTHSVKRGVFFPLLNLVSLSRDTQKTNNNNRL